MSRLMLFGSLFILLLGCSPEQPDLDTLIKGGQVINGKDLEASQLDIGIKADTIAFIGQIDETTLTYGQVIDASGYYVTPGFIDPHTHALDDLSDSTRKYNLNYLLQGVTTVVTGSDGNSDNFIAERLEGWETNGIGTNAAIMVGHRNIRKLTMGMAERSPTDEEMQNMKTMVHRGMDAGALGFSSGLYYSPASFAETEEVIELAKISAEYGGLYDAHIRDESSYNIGVVAAVSESIEIAEKANTPANISHIKCLGTDVWDLSQTIIDTVEAARARGLQITADQYPYLASGTSLSNALLPKWVFADLSDYTQKFDDPELLPQIEEGVTDNLRRRGGPSSILLLISSVPDITGKTLADVAEERGTEPVATALDIIKNGGARIASFNMKPEDLQRFMQQEWVMTCSDGTNAHPRKYASFPKKIEDYVVNQSLLSLPQMVRRSSGLTAETFGISKRGTLEIGHYADILVFKPEELRANATFPEPDQLCSGWYYIFLNGEVVVENDIPQGKLVGRVVRR